MQCICSACAAFTQSIRRAQACLCSENAVYLQANEVNLQYICNVCAAFLQFFMTEPNLEIAKQAR
jgi:hypothetical protein